MLTNPSVTNPEAFRAPFGSDHSSVMHFLCQTPRLQYRSNNCYIIPVTQWQCICFVSLNYSVPKLFSPPNDLSAGKPGQVEDAHRKTAVLQWDMNSADLPPVELSSPQTQNTLLPSLSTSVLLFRHTNEVLQFDFHIIIL